MFLAAIIDDPLGIVLAIGVLVSASSAVVYFTSRPTKRAAPQAAPRPATAREIMSASSALARAQAAARERSSAATSLTTQSPEGYRLTGVRPARPPRSESPTPHQPPQSTAPAGGQRAKAADGDGADADVVTAQARAIAFHIAETDPQRMAEVIRTWIQEDRLRQDEVR